MGRIYYSSATISKSVHDDIVFESRTEKKTYPFPHSRFAFSSRLPVESSLVCTEAHESSLREISALIPTYPGS